MSKHTAFAYLKLLIRGHGGPLTILEEGAYVTEAIVKTVVLPTLTVRGSFLIMLSTLTSDPSSLFTRIMNSNVLSVHAISYICEECQAMGVRQVCIHRKYTIPPWQQTNNSLIKNLFGDDEDIVRENMGVIVQDDNKCFNRSKVDTFLSRPRVEIYEPVRYIFMSFDPVTGADNAKAHISDFVITTICTPYVTILGTEAIEVHSITDYEPIMKSLIRKLRNQDMFQNAVIVVDAEAGTGLEASHIHSICQQFKDVICLNTGSGKKHGINTTHARKKEAMTITRTMLDTDSIRVYKGFITHHPDENAIFAKMRDQFYKYERYVKASNSVHTPVSVCYSGKGKNKKDLDDVCFTLQRCILTQHEFLNTNKYDKFH